MGEDMIKNLFLERKALSKEIRQKETILYIR